MLLASLSPSPGMRARVWARASALPRPWKFANQYLEEHQSDLGCPPDLLRAIRSWEEGEPLPDFLFDLPPATALTEAERERQAALRKALSAGSDSD